MKESYLTSAFRETVHERFFAQEAELTAAFTKRLQELRRENAGATKEKQRHLEGQILPGIAAYETLQTVLPKEEALQTVHGYVERRAWRLKRIFLRLVRVAIQNFLKNPVISMVFGHPNRKISCISPHIRAAVLKQPPFFYP